jgi:glycosyltransferase involved in cell wall biosynthesis
LPYIQQIIIIDVQSVIYHNILPSLKNFYDFYKKKSNTAVKPKNKKRIIVSATSDLVSDNRVHKVCMTLYKMGFDILLIGRLLTEAPGLVPRIYKTKRLKLLFNKGFMFYACFNIRLFFYLLFSKFDLLLSNDLDSLTANFIISKIKNKPLVYDSHEYFTESPQLIKRGTVRIIWEWLEQLMLPRIKYAYTVCNSIAKIYNDKYGTDFKVVRNISSHVYKTPETDTNNTGMPKIILYQGALNEGRGLHQAILAMKYVEGAKLVIAGDGSIKNELEKLITGANMQHKAELKGRLSIEELAKLTPKAYVGLSIEEDMGLNYHFTLPNKLFDYIQAGVPVIVTNLPEMAAIVRHYGVGEVISSPEPEILAEAFNKALYDETVRKKWKKNLIKAGKELTWENEENTLKDIFKPFI